MDHSHKHYILTDFTKLNKKIKSKFLLLTKYILRIQYFDNTFKLFNLEHDEKYIKYFLHPYKDIEESEFNDIVYLFKNKEIYLFIKNICNKCKKIKRIDKNIIKYLYGDNEKYEFFRLYKVIILFNLINKRLSEKTPEEIKKYMLAEKLDEIDEKLKLFNLNDYNDFNNYKHIYIFLQKIYTDDDIYNKIYDTFDLFI